MKRPKGKGRIWRRGEDGFDKVVLATSFNARDSGARPDMLVEAKPQTKPELPNSVIAVGSKAPSVFVLRSYQPKPS